MIALLAAAAGSFLLAILVTPLVIRWLRDRNIGQFIQEEVEGHYHKQGTPTMGGIIIIGAAVIGYLIAHLRVWVPGRGIELSVVPLRAGGLLLMGAFVGMGLIGLVDDYLKVSRERNLGLNKRSKYLGQLVIAGLFAWGAVSAGASTELAFTRSIGVDLGPVYFLWVLLMLTGAANAVNITDGMDGLAAGSGALVFGAFMFIGFWQFRHPEFYSGIVSPLDLSVAAAAIMGATMAFLWWNAAPAQVFMGDVGSQALGGAMAALALLTNTHLLLVVLGGLYVFETLSVILQVARFKVSGQRIFRMSPIHYHFELGGWPETTVVVRFWILAGLAVALGLGIFYGDFIAAGGIG